ncbi:MAG TPA: cytochrome c, partial [Ideonella sp.]|nr:cytochrome c [Ideonella sp.]
MTDPRTDPGISAQHRRENAEPEERANPVPWPVLLGVGAVFAACIVYIAYASVDTPSDWGDGRTQAELAGEPKAAGPAAVDGAA